MKHTMRPGRAGIAAPSPGIALSSRGLALGLCMVLACYLFIGGAHLPGWSEGSDAGASSRLEDSAAALSGRAGKFGSLRRSSRQVDDTSGMRLTRASTEDRSSRASRSIANAGDRPAQRRRSTLVLYVYNAADAEQQRNFAFFLRWGIREDDGVTYRIILTSGSGVLALADPPQLPQNAQYLRSEACSSSWGALGAVVAQLPLDSHKYYVVLDSSVRGPFIPPYAQHALHWTEAFTSRLSARVGLVGAAISCEGAPKGGDAAGEWRANPYVLPYAWATHRRGWQLLQKEQKVFACHASAWEARYWSDSGASLAVLRAGLNLDCLLTRYQGVNWADRKAWRCNERVRPDAEMTYDGVSLTPYETVFVPVSTGPALNNWTFVEQAVRYERYLEQQASGSPDISSNAYVGDAWDVRAQRLVYMNARGPGCFDFRYYVQHNPDVAAQAANPLALWEHFLLLGQFQGRRHRFSCPVMVGNSYRLAYARSRGHRCFDHNYYLSHNPDLAAAGLKTGAELWGHYVGFGQFEQRPVKYTCADTVTGLERGYDSLPVSPALGDDKHTQAEAQQQLEIEAQAHSMGTAGQADAHVATAEAAADAAAMQQIQGTAELEWNRRQAREQPAAGG